jgi:hypothetical protein
MSASILLLASMAACALLAYLALRGRSVGMLDLLIACALAVPVDWLAWILRGSFSTGSGWIGLFPMLGLFLVLPLALFLTLAAWLIAARLVHLTALGWAEPDDEIPPSAFHAVRYWVVPMVFALLLGWCVAFLAVKASRGFGLELPVSEKILFLAVLSTFALFGVLDAGTRMARMRARRDAGPELKSE